MHCVKYTQRYRRFFIQIQTTAVTMELTFRSCRRGMTGEFSLDLEGLSVTGGERLCDANCVSKFNLLMSGSLSIRLKETPQEMFTRWYQAIELLCLGG